ncbi:MAG TPA: DUF4926 domain-containing protein [Clostridiales bacterium]|jgi:hypothetical protein|nr:DUF4926 domain-containing protein [Clostridiales bacterium]
MLKLLDVVRLKEDNVKYGVKASYRGTIVDVLNCGEAFTIEFFDENGETVEAALFTEFTPDEIELIISA